MCALYAAGFPPAGRAVTDPDFVALRSQLLALQGPATEGVRKFYKEHTLSDSGAMMSRYVSWALVAGPAPNFAITASRDDLPSDVVALEGFSPVLAAFYKEAQIAQRWQHFEPVYERDAASLRQPIGAVVLSEIGYLRELVQSGSRTFTVYAEPLVGGNTNFRNIGDRYFVVVNPDLNSFDEVRHAFLHFLLDPLPIKYAPLINATEPLYVVAQHAPRLPYVLRNDFSSFYTECLVRVVELRVRHLSPSQIASQLDRDEADGYVLERPMMAALGKFEMADPAMDLYFPDFAASIDVKAETARLQSVKFATGSDSKQTDAQPVTNLAPDLTAELGEGDRNIAAQNAPAAQEAFERVLLKVPGMPRALFGLAMASIMQGNAERAQMLFEQIVAEQANPAEAGGMVPDASQLAWSHVYLGRLDDLMDNREDAVLEYRAALAVAGAPDAAHSAAQNGITQKYQTAGHDAPSDQK